MIHKQLTFCPDMIFHRIMTRAVLGKFISRKSNDKVFWKCKRKHICGVFCNLGLSVLLWNIKNTCRSTLILVNVTGRSTASLKLIILLKWCKLSQIQNKTYFQVVLVCFSEVSWKLNYFLICSFNRRWKHHQSIFILHQFQLVPNSHIYLTLSSSKYLTICKERKRSSDPCKIPADQ